jgi:hypothetical protein
MLVKIVAVFAYYDSGTTVINQNNGQSKRIKRFTYHLPETAERSMPSFV